MNTSSDCLEPIPTTRTWDLRAYRSFVHRDVVNSTIHADVAAGHELFRTSDGCAKSMAAENVCTSAVQKCFSTDQDLFVNPHPVSGSIANLAVLSGVLKPGDTLLSIGVQSIGHVSLGGQNSFAERLYRILSLDLPRNDARIDFHELWKRQGVECATPPRLIAFGPTAYPSAIDWSSLRMLANSFSPPALLLLDVSHLIGPITAKILENPLAFADVITFTAYKSLCGPPGAVIVCQSRDIHERISSALIPGLQDRAYLSSLDALAGSLRRATSAEFARMQQRAAFIAKRLGQHLVAGGLRLAFAGTETHLLVLDLAELGLAATDARAILSAEGILCDPVRLPGDLPDRSTGLRIGAIALAQSECSEQEVLKLAHKILAMIARGSPINCAPQQPVLVATKTEIMRVNGAHNAAIGRHDGPDEFMFRQFRRHSSILRKPARSEYFMLSSGANQLPMSSVWKELLHIEVDHDLAYGWYTSQQGFPPLQRIVSMYENYAASEGQLSLKRPLGSNICMTVGASQGVAAVFDYVARNRKGNRVLLIGLNYGLFERLSRHYNFQITECIRDSDHTCATLPPVSKVTELIESLRPGLIVLTSPNNPSGEQYSAEEIRAILIQVSKAGSLILIDQVGHMPFCDNQWINIGALVSQTNSQSSTVLVNSFSKSDGVPGFRLGYLLGPNDVIAHTAQYQLNSIMNPPTVPALPVFFSLVARMVHMGERFGWLHSRERLLTAARRVLTTTTAIAPTSMMEKIMSQYLATDTFGEPYEDYLSSQRLVQQAIQENHSFALTRLGDSILRKTELVGGFNFLIELGPFIDRDEDELCESLFTETSVAILTESCFRVTPRKRRNFWVRLSLAAPREGFNSAIDRLANWTSKRA